MFQTLRSTESGTLFTTWTLSAVVTTDTAEVNQGSVKVVAELQIPQQTTRKKRSSVRLIQNVNFETRTTANLLVAARDASFNTQCMMLVTVTPASSIANADLFAQTQARPNPPRLGTQLRLKRLPDDVSSFPNTIHSAQA